MVPLAPDRFALQLTIGEATRGKLLRAQALLRHQVQSGDLAEVLDRALDALLEKVEARKFGQVKAPRAGAAGAPRAGTGTARRASAAGAPRAGTGTARRARAAGAPRAGAAGAPRAGTGTAKRAGAAGARRGGAVEALRADAAEALRAETAQKTRVGRAKWPSRYVPREVRRRVVARDGARCSFVGEDGRRCEETGFLELDHVLPVARGGQASVAGVRVLCRAHNQYEAERILGREAVEAGRMAREERGGARIGSRVASAGCDGAVRGCGSDGGSGAWRAGTLQKLKREEALRAIAERSGASGGRMIGRGETGARSQAGAP